MVADPAVLAMREREPASRPDVDDRPHEDSNDGSDLAGGLIGLDRRLGHAWSVRSLRRCLSLALIYCWIAYFLGWGLGGSGRIGDVDLLANPGQPARLASALSAMAAWSGAPSSSWCAGAGVIRNSIECAFGCTTSSAAIAGSWG